MNTPKDLNTRKDYNKLQREIRKLKEENNKLKKDKDYYDNKCEKITKKFQNNTDMYNELERNYNKLKSEASMEIKLDDGIIRKIRIIDLIQIPRYYAQRIIDEKRVDEVYSHLIYKNDNGNCIQFPSMPIIVQQLNSNDIFIADKERNRVSEVAIDGQHRIKALSKFIKNFPDFTENLIPVRIVYCETQKELENLFNNINKAVSFTVAEKEGFQDATKELMLFRNNLKKCFPKYVVEKAIMHSKLTSDHLYEAATNNSQNSKDFCKFIENHNINCDDLSKVIKKVNEDEFEKLKDYSMTSKEFETYLKQNAKRKRIKFKKSQYIQKLMNNLKEYNQKKNEKLVICVLGLIYFKEYNKLIHKIHDKLREELNIFEEEDSE